MSQTSQQRANLCQGKAIIDGHMVYGALWHAGVERLTRILHDSDAIALLDCEQTRGAIVECARQHDASDARTIGIGERAKERINSGSMAILPGTTCHTNMALLYQEMVVRGSDVDMPIDDFCSIFGMQDGQGTDAI